MANGEPNPGDRGESYGTNPAGHRTDSITSSANSTSKYWNSSQPLEDTDEPRMVTWRRREFILFFVFIIVVFCPGFVCLFRFREVLVCVFGRGGGRFVFLFECFCWVSQWLLMKIGALLF